MLKSEWRLLYNMFKRVLKLTIRTIFNRIKLFFAVSKFQYKLEKRRKTINDYIQRNSLED